MASDVRSEGGKALNGQTSSGILNPLLACQRSHRRMLGVCSLTRDCQEDRALLSRWRTQEGRTAFPLRDTAGGIERCSPRAASKDGTHRAGTPTSLASHKRRSGSDPGVLPRVRGVDRCRRRGFFPRTRLPRIPQAE